MSAGSCKHVSTSHTVPPLCQRRQQEKNELKTVTCMREGEGDCKARMVMLLKGGNERVRVKERGKTG